MPFLLERFDSLGYVVVRHYGRVSPGEIEEVYKSVHGSNRDGEPLPGLIIDVRDCTTYLTTAELFGSLNTFHHRPRGAKRTAFIADGAFMDEVRFVELASANRGIPVRAFTNEADAFEWLGVEPGQSA